MAWHRSCDRQRPPSRITPVSTPFQQEPTQALGVVDFLNPGSLTKPVTEGMVPAARWGDPFAADTVIAIRAIGRPTPCFWSMVLPVRQRPTEPGAYQCRSEPTPTCAMSFATTNIDLPSRLFRSQFREHKRCKMFRENWPENGNSKDAQSGWIFIALPLYRPMVRTAAIK
jgi:hypothetical protein